MPACPNCGKHAAKDIDRLWCLACGEQEAPPDDPKNAEELKQRNTFALQIRHWQAFIETWQQYQFPTHLSLYTVYRFMEVRGMKSLAEFADIADNELAQGDGFGSWSIQALRSRIPEAQRGAVNLRSQLDTGR